MVSVSLLVGIGTGLKEINELEEGGGGYVNDK